MKRHAIALCIHPFKDCLVSKTAFREMLAQFTTTLVKLCADYPTMRINVVLPACYLEYIAPLHLSELREIHKRSGIEWLTPGYTDPFVSLSPLWLSKENISAGIETFQEFLGVAPGGYVPAFSNWEPVSVDMLHEAGLQYVLLSNTLLPQQCRSRCGYWATEYGGSSILIFPAHVLDPSTAPPDAESWLETVFAEDEKNGGAVKLVCIDYCISLGANTHAEPFQWLENLFRLFDKLLLKFQPLRFQDFLVSNPPCGLLYIPPSLTFGSPDESVIPFWRNWLFTFDQVGIMQRKMLDICEMVGARKEEKVRSRCIRQLFHIQDMSRFLPGTDSGFPHLDDRMWSYHQMIALEKDLFELEGVRGGQIRIIDFLKNGNKSVIMGNKGLKVYIDHKYGGQIFELDYRHRALNLCAGYTPDRYVHPGIHVPGKSKSAFIDHFFDETVDSEAFQRNEFEQWGDFVAGQFEYAVKKSDGGVKTVLTRQGAVVQDGKPCPLSCEKVFALDSDAAALSFVYQFTNSSLSKYRFVFGTELTVSLPGVSRKKARLRCNGTTIDRLESEQRSFEAVSLLECEDKVGGFAIEISLQKPMRVWCFPLVAQNQYQGTTLVFSSPVGLDENSQWSWMGKVLCKKLRSRESERDEI
jgi:hypothetical protein